MSRDELVQEEVKTNKHEIERAIAGHAWYQRIPLGHGIYTPGETGEYSERKLQMMQFAETVAGKTMLDIGCNEGFFTFEAERSGATRVLAIDQNKKAQEKFELVRRISGRTAAFRLMGVYDLDPEVIGQFDVVLFLAVFHHLRYPFLALDKIAAVTKEVAMMEIVEAVPKQPSQQAALVRHLGRKGQLRMAPTREFLLEMLERAGFPRVEILAVHRSHVPKERRKLYDYSLQRVVLKAYRQPIITRTDPQAALAIA